MREETKKEEDKEQEPFRVSKAYAEIFRGFYMTRRDNTLGAPKIGSESPVLMQFKPEFFDDLQETVWRSKKLQEEQEAKAAAKKAAQHGAHHAVVTQASKMMPKMNHQRFM